MSELIDKPFPCEREVTFNVELPSLLVFLPHRLEGAVIPDPVSLGNVDLNNPPAANTEIGKYLSRENPPDLTLSI